MTPSPQARPSVSAPAPLTAAHDFQQFSCGKVALDDWLHLRALKAEARSARTYVTCVGDTSVVAGYYSFAAGGVRMDEIPKKMRRNMPQIVPVTILARLAVDARYRGMGIGKGLLKDGLRRALQASQIVGSTAVLVHAIDDEAAAYYAGFGFQEFPDASRTLFLPMHTIAAAL